MAKDNKKSKEPSKKEQKKLQKLITLRNKAIDYRKNCWDWHAKHAWNYYWYGQKDKPASFDKTRKANYVFSTVEGIIPKVFDKMPGYQVLGRGEDDQISAPIVEQILKYEWNRMDVDSLIVYSMKDCLVPGYGLLKPYWDPDEDCLATMVVNPFNFWITAGDAFIQSAVGVFERIFMPIEDAVEAFDKSKDDFPEFSPKDSSTLDQKSLDMLEDADHTAIFEYRGKLDGEEVVIRFNDTCILDDSIEPYEHGLRPYIPLPDYRTAHEFYATGEVFELTSLQDELVEMDAQMSRWRKSCVNPKKYVVRGGLDKTNEQRAKNPSINLVTENQQGAVRWEQPPVIGRDLYTMRAQVKEDIGLTSGQAEISRGGTERVVQTATGQEIINQAAEGRNREKTRMLSRAIKQLLEQYVGLLAEFQSEKKTIKILDTSEIDVFKEYDKRDIKGNYDYIVDITESMPTHREKRARLALEAYAQFKDDPAFDQIALKKMVAKKAFEDIQAESLIKNVPQEPPVEEGMVDQGPMVPGMEGVPPGAGQAPSPNLMPGQEMNQAALPALNVLDANGPV